MRQLDYAGIFWTLLSVKWGMTCVAFIGAFLFLWINIRQAARNSFALAEDDPAKKAGSLEKTHVIEIQGIPISRRVCDASHGTRRGCSRGDLCAGLLCAMGHLSPLSLRRLLRVVGPHLWSRRGVLSLSSSVLSAPAGQPRILDGAGDRGRRFPIRILRATAIQRRSTNRDLGECRSASFRAPFHPGRCLWMGLLPGSVRPFVLHDGRGLWSWIYGRSCDHDCPLGHDRRLGGGLRTSRAQFLPSAMEGHGDRSGRLRGAVRYGHRARACSLSKVRGAAERAQRWKLPI